jgi:hypothetical protein
MKGVSISKTQGYEIPEMRPTYVCTHFIPEITFVKVFS